MRLKEADREKVALDVMTEMENHNIIDYKHYCDKYGFSKQTFYNVMKEYNIDFASHNRSSKKDSKEESVKLTTDSNSTFQIVHRDDAFDDWMVDLANKSKEEPLSSKSMTSELPKQLILDTTAEKCDEMYHPYNSVVNKFVIAGLISDRHHNIDSSLNLYVFRGPIRQEYIHDYDKLYDIADKFIKDNVIGLGYTKLKVVVTGLTQCTGAIITAAINNKVTLVLMHYNNISRKYGEQLICGNWNDRDIIANGTSLLDLYASTKRYADIQLYGHDQVYYSKLKKLYIVKFEDLDNKKSTVYIFDEIDKMFTKYSKEVQKVMNEKFQSYRVTADEIQYGSTNMEFNFTNNLGTYYNKPKS